MRARKLQVMQVVVDKAAAAGIHSIELDQIEKDYDVEGFEILAIHESGQTNYRFGLQRGSMEVIKKVHKDAFLYTTAVAPNERMKKVAFSAMQDVITSNIELFAANDGVNDLKLDIIFHLVHKSKSNIEEC